MISPLIKAQHQYLLGKEGAKDTFQRLLNEGVQQNNPEALKIAQGFILPPKNPNPVKPIDNVVMMPTKKRYIIPDKITKPVERVVSPVYKGMGALLIGFTLIMLSTEAGLYVL